MIEPEQTTSTSDPPTPDWARSPQERRSLADLGLVVFAIVVFSLFGGGTKLLAHWNPLEPWQRKLGGLMGSVFAGCIVGIPLTYYPWFADKLGLVIVGAGVGSWAGLEFIDRMTVRLERTAASYLPKGVDGESV